ncbi:MAG: 3-oxoacyl-ACP reductase FabG, partial [Moraxellaceae bacterium]|nr:3-oxoacyl-ACP reductase FabG [Moraxellaceae bacterium]
MSIEGKIALVTGASRGIGKAIALELARRGAVVVGTATSAAGAEAISAYLKEAGNTGRGIALNVADPASIEAALAEINSAVGAPVILVNNAGITRDNLMLRMKDEEWDDVITTNLSAIYRMTKACLKGMTKERWGRVISISSVVGSSGNPGQANYAAAKAGLEGFSRALAREIGSRNITVNAVAPGFIATDMTHVLPDEQKEKLLSSIPAGRLGQPEEIAAAVGFLASAEASYITGVTLHVNGGMYM